MKKIILFIIMIIIIATVITLSFILKINYNQKSQLEGQKIDYLEENKNEIYVVPTMQDTIKENSVWCGTFQLVWNDMQDNLVRKKVVFDEPNEFVDNLNLQKFKEKELSEESYYKKWGLVSETLKKEIEDGIKNKFDEPSDVLNGFNWEEEDGKYIFYAMLKKEFEFPQKFDILKTSNFKNIENVSYFGIDENTSSSAREQVEVLYYRSNSNFAVKLNTKGNDEIIMARKTTGSSFENIYKEIINISKEFNGETEFGKFDILKIPNIKMNILREFDELTKKIFLNKEKQPVYIDKAVQTIKMELDHKGGKIKSESAMGTITLSQLETIPGITREFIFNDDYVIFLKEKDKDMPYFAAYINDINLFAEQEIAE